MHHNSKDSFYSRKSDTYLQSSFCTQPSVGVAFCLTIQHRNVCVLCLLMLWPLDVGQILLLIIHSPGRAQVLGISWPMGAWLLPDVWSQVRRRLSGLPHPPLTHSCLLHCHGDTMATPHQQQSVVAVSCRSQCQEDYSVVQRCWEQLCGLQDSGIHTIIVSACYYTMLPKCHHYDNAYIYINKQYLGLVTVLPVPYPFPHILLTTPTLVCFEMRLHAQGHSPT